MLVLRLFIVSFIFFFDVKAHELYVQYVIAAITLV